MLKIYISHKSSYASLKAISMNVVAIKRANVPQISSFLLRELIQQEVTTMLVDNRIHTIGINVEEYKSKPSSPITNAYETQGT